MTCVYIYQRLYQQHHRRMTSAKFIIVKNTDIPISNSTTSKHFFLHRSVLGWFFSTAVTTQELVLTLTELWQAHFFPDGTLQSNVQFVANADVMFNYRTLWKLTPFFTRIFMQNNERGIYEDFFSYFRQTMSFCSSSLFNAF